MLKNRGSILLKPFDDESKFFMMALNQTFHYEIFVSFKITIQILEEYLKSKILTALNNRFHSKIVFQFFLDSPYSTSKRKRATPLNEVYTLEDIFTLNNENTRSKKAMSFKFRVNFENDQSFQEIIKLLPNKDILSKKIIQKIGKKIKKKKQSLRKSNNSLYKTQKSIFSSFNNSAFFNHHNNTNFGDNYRQSN